MILKMNANEMEVISEDQMDVEYLESLFAGSVCIKKESIPRRCGFCIIEERDVSVQFTKTGKDDC